MHKLFNTFQYRKIEIIPGLSSENDNKIVKFDQVIDLKVEHFKNYFRLKLANLMTKYDYYKVREMCSHMQLDSRSGTENIINGVTKYLAESYVSMIHYYTRFDDEIDLKKEDRLRNHIIQADLMKMIQMINSSKIFTEIDGTSSCYISGETTVNHDLNEQDLKKYVTNTKYTMDVINIVCKIIGKSNEVRFENYDEFFNVNQNCLNCYAKYIESDKSVHVYVGEGSTIEDFELSILLCQNLIQKDEWYANSKRMILDYPKVLSFLKYRDLNHTSEFSVVEGVRDIVKSRISNIFSKSSNEKINLKSLISDGNGGNEDETDRKDFIEDKVTE